MSSHSFKRLIRLGLTFMALGYVSVMAQAVSVTEGPGTVPVWEPVEVTATLTGFGSVQNVELCFFWGAGAMTSSAFTNRVAMTSTGGATYSATLEGMPAGTVSYFAVAHSGGMAVNSEFKNYMVLPGDSGNTARFTDVSSSSSAGVFGLWQQAASGYNHPAATVNEASCEVIGDDGLSTEWRINHGRVATGTTTLTLFSAAELTAFGATAPVLQLYNFIGSEITSPRLAHGIGTLYFTSKIYGSGQSATLRVDVSAVADPSPADWISKGQIAYTSANPAQAVALAINDRNVKRVRIYRETGNTSGSGTALTIGAVVVDNIMLSIPSSGMGVQQETRNPASPSALGPTWFTCAVTNMTDRFPAVNKKVTLWYKWYPSNDTAQYPVALPPMPTTMPQGDGAVLNESGWAWTNMTLSAGSNVGTGTWEVKMPAFEAGYVYYFYRFDFDGQHYERSPDGTAPLVSTKVSPVYYPDLKASTGNPHNEERVFGVAVITAPTVTVESSPANPAIGQSVTLTAKLVGFTNVVNSLVVYCSQGGVTTDYPMTASDASTYVATVQYAVPGQVDYYAIAYTADKPVESLPGSFIVQSPGVQLASSAGMAYIGEPVTLTATLKQFGTLSGYSVKLVSVQGSTILTNNMVASGADTYTYAFKSLQPGTVVCKAIVETGVLGTLESSNVNITLNLPGIALDIAGDEVDASVDEPVTFTATLSGFAGLDVSSVKLVCIQNNVTTTNTMTGAGGTYSCAKTFTSPGSVSCFAVVQAGSGATMVTPVVSPIRSLSINLDTKITVSQITRVVNAWDAPEITATLIGFGGLTVYDVTLYFTHGASSFTSSLAMSSAGGNTYTATLEGLPIGAVSYYAVVRASSDQTATSSVETYTIIEGDSGNTVRFTDVSSSTIGGFGLWRQAASGYNHPATADNWASCEVTGEDGLPTEWRINHGRVATGTTTLTLFTAAELAAFGATAPVLQMYNCRGSEIISPRLTHGAGTLYFTSKIFGGGYSATLRIDVSTVADPAAGDWVEKGKVAYTSANPTQAVALLINDRNVKRVRIYRETAQDVSGTANQYTTGAVVMDNIMISIPSADVKITAPEARTNPGYPSEKDPITFQCKIENDSDLFPAFNKKVTLWYKWYKTEKAVDADQTPWAKPVGSSGEVNGWQWMDMELTDGDADLTGTWEATISAPPSQGRVQYYFRCDYDGYYYERSPDGIAQKDNTKTSPRNLHYDGRAGLENQERSAMAEVRRYRSEMQVLSLDTSDVVDSPIIPLSDMKLVGDYTWQGLISLKNVANMKWVFKGHRPYKDGEYVFDAANWLWGAPAAVTEIYNPPVADSAVRDSITPIEANTESVDGFLLFRLNTQTGEYIVKRAVYQDFNKWQASLDKFEDSVGHFAVQEESTNFRNWVSNVYGGGDVRWEDFQGAFSWQNGNFMSMPTRTQMYWVYQQGKVLEERFLHQTKNNRTDFTGSGLVNVITNMSNRALSLDGNDTTRGAVWMTSPDNAPDSDNFTDGVKDIRWNVRASLHTPTPAVYTGAAMSTPANMSLITYAYAADYSDAKDAGFSVLLGPSVPWQYYEVRFTQASSTVAEGANADARMQVEVYRWANGVSTRIDVAKSTGDGFKLNQRYTIENSEFSGGVSARRYIVELAPHPTNPGTTTRITVKFGQGTAAIQNFTFDDVSSARLLEGRSFGYLANDADMRILGARAVSGAVDAAATITSGTLVPASATNFGMMAADWEILAGALQPVMNPQVYTLYRLDIPQGGFPLDYLSQLFANPVKEFWTNNRSFAWGSETHTLNVWNRQLIALSRSTTNTTIKAGIQHPVVFDEIVVNPWRASTRAESLTPEAAVGGVRYMNWTTTAQQNAWAQSVYGAGWLVFEGWVDNLNTNSALKEVVFERSRANPTLDQALYSPVLTNGVGSISFDWVVEGGDMDVVIQYSSLDFLNEWVDFETLTLTPTNGSYYAAIRQERPLGFQNRIRVWVQNANQKSKLKLRNLVARGYPPRDPSAWSAYNSLITGHLPESIYPPDKFIDPLFDLGAENTRSAVLNNDPRADTGGKDLNKALPYIQTPAVETGIGEIAFWYRNMSTNGAPARLVLLVTTDANPSDDSVWVDISTAITLSTDIRTGEQISDVDAVKALQNIKPTEDWLYFNIMPFNKSYKALRLVCQYNVDSATSGRVALDEVIMTEPMRPGFAIMKVIMYANTMDGNPIFRPHQSRYPGQPLANQRVGFDVQIGRLVMTPEDIQVYVSYQTNPHPVPAGAWGADNWLTSQDNWWQTRRTGVQTIRLYPDENRRGWYSSTNGMVNGSVVTSWLDLRASGNVDDVVQFIAWGDYKQIRDENDEPIVQERIQNNDQSHPTFTNPEWYNNVDLNVSRQSEGWSPYYFIYSCPPRSVLMNEFYYYYSSSTYRQYELLELIGPAGSGIGGWKVEMRNSTGTPENPQGLTLYTLTPAAAPKNVLSSRPEQKGWGFYVWGASGVTPPDRVDVPYTNSSTPNNGTLTLFRSNGVIEQRLAFGGNASQSMIPGYTYIGSRNSDNMLALGLGTAAAETVFLEDDAKTTANWQRRDSSAGGFNSDQLLKDLTDFAVRVLAVTSRIVSGQGSITPLILSSIRGSVTGNTIVNLTEGDAVKVTYTAAAWNRITALKVNNVLQNLAPGGQKEFVWTQNSLDDDYTNEVTFTPVDPTFHLDLQTTTDGAVVSSVFDGSEDPLEDLFGAVDLYATEDLSAPFPDGWEIIGTEAVVEGQNAPWTVPRETFSKRFFKALFMFY